MTRAEIREFMTDGFDGTYDFLESKADSIFDYFSGKTCSSCKHRVIYNRREVRCDKSVVENRALDNNSDDFGCNKYEAKEKKDER